MNLTSKLQPCDLRQSSASIFSSRSEGFACCAGLALILCLASGWVWCGEEPSKLHTIVVCFSLCFVATALVLIATRLSWITSPGFWILTFSIKMAASLLITYYAWYEPLSPDLLRVEAVVPGVQDSNLYDYYAYTAAQNGLIESWSLLNFTWLSFGITGYLALVYKVFGFSIAYVSMCNALLSLIGLIMLSATLNFVLGVKRMWALVALAGLIPSVAFYDATPAKEPLTTALYYSVLFAIARLFWRRRSSFAVWFSSCWALVGLAVVRANVVFMVIVSNAWPVIKRLGVARSFMIGLLSIGAAASLLIVTTGSTKSLMAIIDLNERFRQTRGFVEERAEAGEGGLKQLVAENLSPHGIGDLILLSPIRAVIWFCLPYPFLKPASEDITPTPTLGYEERLAKVQAIHEQCFVATGWLIVLALPFILGAIWATYRKVVPGLEIFVVNLVGTSMIIGNLMFIMGRRYRTLIEPLAFAVVLISLHYKVGKRLCLPIYIIMFGGVIAIYTLR